MGLHSLRILAQAGFSGVFFAAKILRGELPRYRLPLPEFAANVIPCSAPLIARAATARFLKFCYEAQKARRRSMCGDISLYILCGVCLIFSKTAVHAKEASRALILT